MGKPKIRFKGYEDDWEQRKLDRCCLIVSTEMDKSNRMAK